MQKNVASRPISIKHFDGKYNGWDQAYGYRAAPRLWPFITKYVWSPIIFKADHRIGTDFVASHWCVLDFDNTLHIEQAKKDFCDYQNLIVYTKSHTEHYHAFRVIIPWERAIADFDEYKYNIKRLIKLCNSDSTCQDLARFYWPSLNGLHSYSAEGDLMQVLDAPDVVTRHFEPPIINNPDTMPAWLRREFSQVLPIGNRRGFLFKAGCQLRRAGYDREAAIAIGAATIQFEGTLSQGEIERHVARGWESENQKT